MKYALLAYNVPSPDDERGPGKIDPAILAVLERPNVSGWVRLRDVSSATTVSSEAGGKTLVTDGPFVDSKEYLGGLIIIEAENLDGALALAAELQHTRTGGAIEIRPILEQELG
jgi:hypothetical protein